MIKHIPESYRVLAVSTAHLNEADQSLLDHMVDNRNGYRRGNMVMERDTGWFIKLYEDQDSFDDLISPLSKEAQRVLRWAHKEGYRMIEFDADADEMPDLSEACSRNTVRLVIDVRGGTVQGVAADPLPPGIRLDVYCLDRDDQACDDEARREEQRVFDEIMNEGGDDRWIW